ncbi:MAG: hypothetical protein AAF386_12815 [Pseudomonadota bacterium]
MRFARNRWGRCNDLKRWHQKPMGVLDLICAIVLMIAVLLVVKP